MKLYELIRSLNYSDDLDDDDVAVDVKFVGMKWQDENHPSAELFPIEFVDAKRKGNTLLLKFITTKHNQ